MWYLKTAGRTWLSTLVGDGCPDSSTIRPELGGSANIEHEAVYR